MCVRNKNFSRTSHTNRFKSSELGHHKFDQHSTGNDTKPCLVLRQRKGKRSPLVIHKNVLFSVRVAFKINCLARV